MNATSTSNTRPSISATILLLVGIVPFMAGLFGLYNVLGVGMPYVGLLFLLYWAAILHQDPKAYLPSLLGGLVGILLGWLLVGLPMGGGRAALIISYIALVAVLFCYMRGHARLVANNATMLYLLVATIPELKIAGNVAVMAESLLLAAGYMGAVSLAMHLINRYRAGKVQQAP